MFFGSVHIFCYISILFSINYKKELFTQQEICNWIISIKLGSILDFVITI